MRCGRIKKMLSAYVDDELTEDGKLFVENHVSRCPSCSQELTDFKKGHQLLSRKGFQTAGPLFWETLKSRLEEKREGLIVFDTGRWLRKLIPVTSALALITYVFLMRNFVEEPPPVTIDSVIVANSVSWEEMIIDPEEKITDDTVLRLVAYHPSNW